MPIAFARLEFVSRTTQKNACAKSAYNSRSSIHFQGTSFHPEKTYNFSSRTAPAFHTILLPHNAHPKFSSPEILWNTVEQKENRSNSQIAIELVLALPDDAAISLQDRIHLATQFLETHFIKKGLAAQLDIHQPHPEKSNHNWHAHALITTRRFSADGQDLHTHKARDLFPDVRNKYVTSASHWGKLWAQHQNTYFEQKGLSLRVDPEGVIPQKHLGPVRLRAKAFSLLQEHSLLQKLNTLESQDPQIILKHITQTRNIFTQEHLDNYLNTHLSSQDPQPIKDAFWKQPQIVQLIDPQTRQLSPHFTTKQILEEEKQLLRLADTLIALPALKATNTQPIASLTREQKHIFDQILSGKRISFLEGHAGTGKSYLLAALKESYTSQGYTVRGLGPDSATAKVLQEKGFTNTDNVYHFLFHLHYKQPGISKNKEIWILDEASKLGTRPLLELLKYAHRYKAQLIFSGNAAQLSSVERTIGFQTLTNRYGTHLLNTIQRQTETTHQQITKNLATGNIAAAIDTLLRLGHFHFSATKEEAIHTLIQKWIADRSTLTCTSQLILAHTNREVRALNQLARYARQQLGELSEKENSYQTAYGPLTLSPGDPIEFRKNNRELGVINGLSGILLTASATKLVVRTQDSSHIISFDPRDYPHFQLAYATTYYRAQGRTLNTTYLLHSPAMNRHLFYVGLTRHTHNLHYFISQHETKNIADLKRQVYRQQKQLSTTAFLTPQDLHNEAFIQKIHSLKSSDSLLDKAKGITLSASKQVHTHTREFFQKYRDQKANKDFFQPQMEKAADHLPARHAIFHTDAALLLQRPITLQPFSPTPQKPQTRTLPKLSEIQSQLLKKYYDCSSEASALYTIVQAEKTHSVQKTPHFSSWQNACGKRNRAADQLLQSLALSQQKALFSPTSLHILQERATKHQLLQEKSHTQHDLNAQLKHNLETLLVRLFPEGPTKRYHNTLRFRAKGSLAVTTSGSKVGNYFDFENNQGGGPLQLIQTTLGTTQKEAISFAKDLLGSSETLSPAFSKYLPQQEHSWFSHMPPPKQTAPCLKQLSTTLAFQYTETARYTYRDPQGNLLFHTLRLEDTSGKKVVLPISYGHYADSQHLHWALKAYSSQERPLYNLPLLNHYPKATILLVEGEKTAEAVLKIFPPDQIIPLTWSGGSSAVSKTDWTPLFLRHILIWPDNDQAGFKAADEVIKHLRHIGIASLRQVDRTLLSTHFPQKWDLADPLPTHLTQNQLIDCLSSAKETTLGIVDLPQKLGLSEKDPITHFRAHQILAHLQDRLLPALHAQHGTHTPAINNALLSHAIPLFAQYKQLTATFQKQLNLSDATAATLSFQHILYQASSGQEPTQQHKDLIRQLSIELSHTSQGLSPTKQVLIDKAISTALHQHLSPKESHRLLNELAGTLSRVEECCRKLEHNDFEREISKQHVTELGMP